MTTHQPGGSPLTAREAGLVAAVVTVVGVVLAVVLVVILGGAAVRADEGPARPRAGVDSSSMPLGSPLPVSAAAGTFQFVAVQNSGTPPVAWDPCRPVRYVIRPDNMPAGGEQAVHTAFARMSQVTGLRFIYDGPTAETLINDRHAFQPDRYGDRWAPVLVQWSSDAENPVFASTTGMVLAQTGSQPMRAGDDPTVFVTGQVDLSAAWFALLLADPSVTEGAERAQAIVLHELGHLVGLDHVEDEAQLMYPLTDQRDFQSGDLAGLAALGHGACVPSL